MSLGFLRAAGKVLTRDSQTFCRPISGPSLRAFFLKNRLKDVDTELRLVPTLVGPRGAGRAPRDFTLGRQWLRAFPPSLLRKGRGRSGTDLCYPTDAFFFILSFPFSNTRGICFFY